MVEADCDHHADCRKNGGRPCDMDDAQDSFVYFFESRSRTPK